MVRLPLSFALISVAIPAQTPPQRNSYNFDERKVAPYTLPDPLVLANGQPVTGSNTWIEKRRPELLAVFEDQVYGKTPQVEVKLRTSQPVVDTKALKGKAIRKQVTLYFTPLDNGPQMHLLLYLPAGTTGPVPIFVGLNFDGNHAVSSDPGILATDVWIRDPVERKKMVHIPPDEHTRGSGAVNWQLEKILAHGYGLATVCYDDIEPDFVGGMEHGVRPVLLGREGLDSSRAPESWSAIGAWAWGLSRVVDYLRAERGVDQRHIALIGHSRLGKTALWAAAQDTRFALVISNESGKGGASLLKRTYGETTDHLNAAFPHWFGPNYKQYTGHPENLPVDGNELLALVAPRPLYVASAAGDLEADPKGEFLSAADAGRVYQLFGKKGLGTKQMPPPDQAIMRDIGYHVRTGKHDVTEFDWDRYLEFAEMHWGKAAAKTP